MTPIIFGEVLFDEFPDNSQVLGGAPFNVAWHLQAFGVNPYFISRIGDDKLGNSIQQTLKSWSMPTSNLQIDPRHPTGRVTITKTATSHAFEIPPNQAFDYIEPPKLPKSIDLLYFGSLCLRNINARASLETLLSSLGQHFVDVNLRKPWYDDDVINLILSQAHWLKLNDEELEILNGSDQSIQNTIESFYNLHPMQHLIVTCGENGAYYYDGNELLHDKTPTLKPIQDTVGAGDAFSAIFLLGICKNWPVSITLKRALSFAADICCIQGATINDKNFYQHHINDWIN